MQLGSVKVMSEDTHQHSSDPVAQHGDGHTLPSDQPHAEPDASVPIAASATVAMQHTVPPHTHSAGSTPQHGSASANRADTSQVQFARPMRLSLTPL